MLLRKATGHSAKVFAAALFAVHPLHVESVSWVSERKDVLSGLCFMLTSDGVLLLRAASFSVFRYLRVAVFLTLGLMAKPMLVMLPIVLLLWTTGPRESPFRGPWWLTGNMANFCRPISRT